MVPDDQTVDGVRIGNGELEVVDLEDTKSLGAAVITALRRSRVGVPHPQQEAWAEQRMRSLSPLIEAAGVRTWRSFARLASVATVATQHSGATVHAWSRDQRRADVFLPDDERSISNVEITPTVLGGAVRQVLRPDT